MEQKIESIVEALCFSAIPSWELAGAKKRIGDARGEIENIFDFLSDGAWMENHDETLGDEIEEIVGRLSILWQALHRSVGMMKDFEDQMMEHEMMNAEDGRKIEIQMNGEDA
jgi:hypothetical protein